MRNFIPSIVIFTLLLVALTVAVTQSTRAQTFTVLHNFTGGQDGANPIAGLTMDRAGNFYGTTAYGGSGYGTIYKLIRKGSAWAFSPLYSFTGAADGRFPSGGVTIGPDGSLYGVTDRGGENGCVQSGGCGVVFNLRPPARACKTALCPWTETVLYRFSGNSDGWSPVGDLIFDEAGNLYGTTSAGGYYGGACSGANGCGVVFELMASHGSWTQSVLYTFTDGNDGGDPEAGLIFDKAGNLYGTTNQGGVYGFGTVFQLMLSGSVWTENTLHSFQRELDGFQPKYSGVISDQFGNLYGTTDDGGLGGGGTVYELTAQGGGWTFNVLYSFSGNGGPVATLAMDAAGDLYDTTISYGVYGYGSVFKLAPQLGGNWTLSSLHDFTGGSDGNEPLGSVALDANGSLYGTAWGGGAYGNGVVWEITP